MKLWSTEIKAVDPRDGKIKTWAGVAVPGVDRRDAEIFCLTHGLDYLKVMGCVGEYIGEMEEHDDLYSISLN